MAMENLFHVALDRHEKLKTKLEVCEATTRARLLAAWKKRITREFLKLLKITDDPETLGEVDRVLIAGNVKERINAKLDKTGGCWLWRGAVRRGRGYLKLGGCKIDPRRVLHEIEMAPLNPGTRLRSVCGNYLCCRPDHSTEAKEDPRVRLMRKIDRCDGHWIWRGSELWPGYGGAYYEGRLQPARRVFYQLFIGPIPEGFYIRQKCRETLCVNPDGLEAVEPIGAFGLKFKVPSAEEVREIRRACRENLATIGEIAKKFGVSTSHVTRIRRGAYRIGREAA